MTSMNERFTRERDLKVFPHYEEALAATAPKTITRDYIRGTLEGVRTFIQNHNLFRMTEEERASYENPAFSDRAAEAVQKGWYRSAQEGVLRILRKLRPGNDDTLATFGI